MYSYTDKQMKHHLDYYKQVKALMEAHQTRAKSIHFRNHALQRQKIANYQNEKERIDGEMNHNNNRGLGTRLLLRRRVELDRMMREIN